MKLAIGNRRQFLSGLLFVSAGGLGLIFSSRYQIGTASEMGPGYYPMCLSILLLTLGLLSTVSNLRPVAGEPIGNWSVVALIWITLGVSSFALVIDRAGLIVAVFALVACVCFERWRRRPLEILFIAASLAATTVALFVYALGLPFAILPPH